MQLVLSAYGAEGLVRECFILASIEALHSELQLYALHDLATLTYVEVEHMQSSHIRHMEWVRSVNHRHAEQKMHDL